MRRIAALDLLRGLAAFAVAIPHFLLYHGIGGAQLEAIAAIAVEVFFALSGFVLGHQILLCVADRGGRSYRIFLIRRWMRTIPPYVVALVLASMLSGKLLSGDFFAYLCYVQNLLPTPQADDYYAVAWSLSVEEWFYVSFPVILLGAARLASRRSPGFCAAVAIGFIAAVSVARALHGDGGNWGFEVRRVVVFRVDSIAYGFLLYLALQRLKFGAGPAVAIAIAAVAGGAAAFAVAERALFGGAIGRQVFPFAAALFGTLLVLAFDLGERWIGRSPAVAALCEYLGRISYSIYLFHSTVLILLGPGAPETATGIRFAVYLAAITALASAFYWWFERPILAARPRFRTAAGEPVSATAEPALQP